MNPTRVLVFCDDLYHPAAVVRAGLAPLGASGEFAFDWIENAAGWNPAGLRDYAAVLLSKSNVCSAKDETPWLAGPNEGALRDYVRAGGGLVAVHSGTASYRDWPIMRAVLGGVFANHPPPCPVTVEPVGGHPLCAGVEAAFTVHDEHYQMLLDDPALDVFLRTRSAHGAQVAGWTRREGRGRVAVLTPGHFPEVWLHASMQRLLVNALHAVVAG
ncbi:MAG: ThuA domain-containing protein [Opitutae bacterium]|nr:ThuA domain-containing protein [Opitutae bacterium]